MNVIVASHWQLFQLLADDLLKRSAEGLFVHNARGQAARDIALAAGHAAVVEHIDLMTRALQDVVQPPAASDLRTFQATVDFAEDQDYVYLSDSEGAAACAAVPACGGAGGEASVPDTTASSPFTWACR